MDILEHLNAIRQDVPACEAVVLADLTTRVILCVSAEDRPPQERLDALCDTAIRLLDSDTSRLMARAGQIPPLEGMTLSAGGVEVFLRTPTLPDEALCCLCRPDVDVERLMEQAHGRLAEIGAA